MSTAVVWHRERHAPAVRPSAAERHNRSRDDPALRNVSVATLTDRRSASGIETRYYKPEVHLASFALPRFLLDVVERGRSGCVADRGGAARARR